jgi:hypothetical protein
MFLKDRLFQLTLLALSLAIGLQAEQAEDTETCSNATLHGSYGLLAKGPGRETGTAVAAIARLTFDGKGNLTGKLIFADTGGITEEQEVTGTYSVSPDCILTDNFGHGSHKSVIVDHGKEFFFLNNGGAITGEARRQ